MSTTPSSPQVFLITGCASGIGRELARRVAATGGRLLATDVNVAALSAVAARLGWQGPEVQTLALDVRDADAWQAAIAHAVAAWGAH